MTVEDQAFAFVLMPFADEFSDIYRLGIKEPANALGVRAERVDEQFYEEGILDRICRQIELADFVIADMTTQNTNVFYEVGYAHAKGKLCILLTQNASDIPFDLKHKRHIVYEGSIQTLRERLTADLRWALDEIDKVQRSRIRIATKRISASLSRTGWHANATVQFSLDMHNDSEVPSAAIESIYFYSSSQWTIREDGQECASSDSDCKPFSTRHYMKSPVTRLPPNGWAQLRFTADGVVANKLFGETLEDSYPVKGHSLLRLATDRGMFDYPIAIDVTADDTPF